MASSSVNLALIVTTSEMENLTGGIEELYCYIWMTSIAIYVCVGVKFIVSWRWLYWLNYFQCNHTPYFILTRRFFVSIRAAWQSREIAAAVNVDKMPPAWQWSSIFPSMAVNYGHAHKKWYVEATFIDFRINYMYLIPSKRIAPRYEILDIVPFGDSITLYR